MCVWLSEWERAAERERETLNANKQEGEKEVGSKLSDWQEMYSVGYSVIRTAAAPQQQVCRRRGCC